MSSREKILSAVGASQPASRELPVLPSRGGEVGVVSGVGGAFGAGGAGGHFGAEGAFEGGGHFGVGGDLSAAFAAVLESIGGVVYTVSGFARIATILHEQFAAARRVVSGCRELGSFGEVPVGDEDPHAFEDVDLAILPAHFGVAENGACWVTEAQMLHRVLPFITQHLVLVIHRRDIVADMHQAYERIAVLESAATPDGSEAAAAATKVAPYGFATFIAGPSKTADIEQSLVLGAHGPMSLTVFLLDEQLSDAGFY